MNFGKLHLTLDQSRYATMLYELTAQGKFPTQKAIADLLGITEVTVSRWNHQERFRAAVDLALDHGLKPLARRAEIASMARAIKGSVLDWQTYLEHGGPTSWRGPVDFSAAGSVSSVPGTTPTGFTVNVYGIPERKPMADLPTDGKPR